jgi:hypothetical protein
LRWRWQNVGKHHRRAASFRKNDRAKVLQIPALDIAELRQPTQKHAFERSQLNSDADATSNRPTMNKERAL